MREPKEKEGPASIAARPHLWSQADAARQLGIGLTKLRELVIAGSLKRVKIGDRSLIPDAEIRRYVADLVASS